MNYITDLEYAQYLKQAKIIAVDIETDTEELEEEWQGKNRGLSFVTDMLMLSIYSPDNPDAIVVLDMRSDFEVKADFLREVFFRPYLTIIAHNASFDLRQLGGKCGFEIDITSRVWDTMVMSIRFMLVDKDAPKESGRRSDLASQLKRFTEIPTADLEFMQSMKNLRAAIHGLDADTLLRYVAMDTFWTYKLYEVQKHLLETLSKEDLIWGTQLGGFIKIPHWPELGMDTFDDDSLDYDSWGLVRWETAISRWAANAGIRGIKLDTDFAMRKYSEWQEKEAELLDKLLAYIRTNEKSDTDRIFHMFVWFDHLLAFNSGQIKSFKNFHLSENWEYHELSSQDIQKYLYGGTEEELKVWANFLATLHEPLTKTKWGKQPVPSGHVNINFEYLIKDLYAIEDTFLQNLVLRWHAYLCNQRYYVPPEDYMSKKYWQPYFIFAQARMPLPSHWDIVYNTQMLTYSTNKLIYDHEQDYLHTDYVELAKKENGFSLSVKALKVLLARFEDHEYEIVRVYQDYLKTQGTYLKAAQEFLLHSEHDGRVHAQFARSTRTGRFRSSQPNQQNINMKDFSGWLVGDENMWLIELDYANAENKLGAIVGADNSFAQATETGDFHMNMARQYFPSQMKAAEIMKDNELIYAFRRSGKSITFGTAYGMGAFKLMRTVGTVENPVSLSDAAEFIQRKKEAFPGVASQQEKIVELITQRFRAGWIPFVRVWTGHRVQVEVFEDGPKGFAGWNYTIQGGIGEAVARSLVIYEIENQHWGYKTRIDLNVHDSLIVNCAIDEYQDVIPKICKIMGGMIPEKYCLRTVPKVHMVTNVGPENAYKWGHQDGKEYPFSMEEFVNEWGVFRLPASELEKPQEKREAPVWIGPMHEGWSLETETAKILADRKARSL